MQQTQRERDIARILRDMRRQQNPNTAEAERFANHRLGWERLCRAGGARLVW